MVETIEHKNRDGTKRNISVDGNYFVLYDILKELNDSIKNLSLSIRAGA